MSAGLFEDFESLRELKMIEKSFTPLEEIDSYLEWKEAVSKVLASKLV